MIEFLKKWARGSLRRPTKTECKWAVAVRSEEGWSINDWALDENGARGCLGRASFDGDVREVAIVRVVWWGRVE